MTVLVLLLLIPLLGAGLVVLAGRVSANAARVSALMTLVVELALAIALAFDTAVHPVSVTQAWIPSFGVSFALEADWLSALLVVLTALLAVASVLVSWKEITERVSSFHVLLLFLIPGVNLVFLARDMMLFYLGWELMLIPMLFLIGGWGTGRKEYAATKFVLFTFGGSIFMLVSLLYVYVKYASQNGGTYSFLFSDLLRTKLDATEQWWVFLGPVSYTHLTLPTIYSV